MNLNLNKVQIQKIVFTASLEKSLSILILPHAELMNSIEQELQENPLLESELEQINALAGLSSSPISHSQSAPEEESDQEEMGVAQLMTLEDHLIQQLYWEISDPFQRKIGEFIIGNLDQDGYLHLSCEEIDQILQIKDILVIKEVLDVIQNFDPIGIGTRNLKESLIIQLHNRVSPYCDLAFKIVDSHLDDLGHKKYDFLAKKLGTTTDEVLEAAQLISTLEPKPASNYRPADPTVYVDPDIRVFKNDEGQYSVETNRAIPSLRINQIYHKLLTQSNISDQEKEFIRERLNRALSFIKNIQQRGSTLSLIAKYILQHQKNFFEGDETMLVPMSLKDVSVHLDRCESTISRAISNKYMDTPQGLFPFKFFFSHSVTRQNDEDISTHKIKEEIIQLIAEENKESPLSDQDIQLHFSSRGMTLARRTVTKYRQMLRIPSSHLRK